MKTKLIILLALLVSSFNFGKNKFPYPFRAGDLSASGNVSILYDINEEGLTRNIRMVNVEAKNYFEQSIMQDVSRWQFAKNAPKKDVKLDVAYRLE